MGVSLLIPKTLISAGTTLLLLTREWISASVLDYSFKKETHWPYSNTTSKPKLFNQTAYPKSLLNIILIAYPWTNLNHFHTYILWYATMYNIYRLKECSEDELEECN